MSGPLAEPWHALIGGLLGPAERALLLSVADSVGWALIDEGPEPRVGPAGYQSIGGRRQGRAAIHDEGLAAALWARVRIALPPLPGGRAPRAMNPRLRFYASEPGQSFPAHTDGAWWPTPTTASALTLLVYLSEGYEGGETAFLDPPLTLSVEPGDALIFPHGRWHEGRAPTSGRKVVLRTDLLYDAAPGAVG